MQKEIVFVILSAIAAFAISYFQYLYKSKENKANWYFAILRFLTVFVILLLLINPKFTQKTFFIEKPDLAIVLDNSASIVYLNKTKEIADVKDKLNSSKLSDKFNLEYYTFDDDFYFSDTLNFSGKQSNINNALKELKRLKRGKTAPVILLSDGNQTYGADYFFSAQELNQEIYPIILGDSLKKEDIAIQNIIVNKYAYLKNKFPVEITANYSGNKEVTRKLTVSKGNRVLFSKNLTFSNTNNTIVTSLYLEATAIGVNNYIARIDTLETEENTKNNVRQFGVEVIDESTNIAIISDILHPDIGMFKKSIEQNIQRKVTLLKSNENQDLNDFQLLILYQPTRTFAKVFNEIKKLEKNYLIVTGPETDWRFLNETQQLFLKQYNVQSQDYGASYNDGFDLFQLDDLGFDEFPPLIDTFGEVIINAPHQNVLNQTINGFSVENPLLTIIENKEQRVAVLFGANIWKWRAQSFLNTDGFEAFDGFVGKLVQFLASNKKKSRLTVAYESFYYGNNNLKISAQYFDRNYVFDPNKRLNIKIKNKETEKSYDFALLLKNSFYEVDLSNLPSGEYNFTVQVLGTSIQQSGSFTVIPFNVEEQFYNPDVTKLSLIATNSGGQSYFVNQIDDLIELLNTDNKYTPVQKSKESVKPLIDWKYLLLLLIGLLTIEWFFRKYKGLI